MRRDDLAAIYPEQRLGSQMQFEYAHMVAAKIPLGDKLAHWQKIVERHIEPDLLGHFTLCGNPRLLATMDAATRKHGHRAIGLLDNKDAPVEPDGDDRAMMFRMAQPPP